MVAPLTSVVTYAASAVYALLGAVWLITAGPRNALLRGGRGVTSVVTRAALQLLVSLVLSMAAYAALFTAFVPETENEYPLHFGLCQAAASSGGQAPAVSSAATAAAAAAAAAAARSLVVRDEHRRGSCGGRTALQPPPLASRAPRCPLAGRRPFACLQLGTPRTTARALIRLHSRDVPPHARVATQR